MHPSMSPVIADQRRFDIRRAAERNALAHAASGRQAAVRSRTAGFHPVAAVAAGLHALTAHAHPTRPAAFSRP